MIAPLVSHWFALKHGPKRLVRRDALPGDAVFRGRLAVPEREADEEALAHLFLTLGHVLQRGLFVVHLLVLGHVGVVAEIVKVAGVCLRVQLRDKRCPRLPQCVPIHFGKVLVFVDILNVGKTLGP